MRFISRHLGYTYSFQPAFVQYLQDGQGGTVSNVITPMIDLKFKSVSLHKWELEAAMAHFRFEGGLVEEDEMTPITNVIRLSVLDTDDVAASWNLDAEKKAEVENKLLNDQFYGQDFIMVVEPRIPAPWPAYDEIRGGGAKTTAEKVMEAVVSFGFNRSDEDLDRIVSYERQNANRADVLAALAAARAELAKAPAETLISA